MNFNGLENSIKCLFCVSVPPNEVKILTQSGNALEDERYNEGTDLSLACSVSGGNILYIDQINLPQKRSGIETLLLSSVLHHLLGAISSART